MFHNLKRKKLKAADENSIENKERIRRDVGDNDYFMSDEGEDKYLSDEGESEFDDELVSFSKFYAKPYGHSILASYAQHYGKQNLFDLTKGDRIFACAIFPHLTLELSTTTKISVPIRYPSPFNTR